VAILLGSGELAFVLVAWRAHPDVAAMMATLHSLPLGNASLLSLAAANVGAVIMPWMIFYQQSAVIDKGLEKPHLRAARHDTAWGAVLTQVVMAAVLIATAATLSGSPATATLDSVQGIAAALEPYLGHAVGVGLFAVGMTGAALVAAIVVSLTAAWALGEALGYSHSLRERPRESPWFYGVYTGLLIAGAMLVILHGDLVRLTIAVEILNALLLPIVLGFLYLLARRALPAPYRLRGWYAVVVGGVVLLTSAFAVYAGGIVPLLSALHAR
jgi:Mn2+/Fe2+ NRAMP family transporter